MTFWTRPVALEPIEKIGWRVQTASKSRFESAAQTVFWLFFVLISCSCGRGAESDGDQRTSAEFFEKKIRPLLVQRCGECHTTEKADESGNLALDNRASLLAGGTRGPVLLAGKPEESLLLKAVRYADPQLQMPPEGKLADVEIELLAKWIRDGAHVPDYGREAGKKIKEIDWSSERQFWSFRPLDKKTPPAVEFPAARNAIDLFISARVQEAGLTPAPAADRRTLIRRLSFDLLGLPPDFEDVREFQADDRPDACERLVDRLLASPHFGERWGRYWLDLARYVDYTPDWQKNTDRAWMYRDWIVRAINEDRPFDDFVVQQLAADLQPENDPANIAALGLLGVSPTYWKELRLAPAVIEVIVADEWDERIDTVTRTFLGLTVACARCHDHKFDPVTTRDYYALAGVFASTQVADRPLLPMDLGDRVMEAREKLVPLQESFKKQKDPQSEEARKLQQQMDEIRQANPLVDAPLALAVEESSVYVVPDGPDGTKLEFRKRQPRDLPVFRRGNPSSPGDLTPRRFLELFGPPASQDLPLSAIDSVANHSRSNFQQGSGRLELARAILDQARPLAARVATNRIWMHHFGKGLVRTPGDFGRQGDLPTHPELLDWLAREFSEGPAGQLQWISKRLHRLIVTSATYRQANEFPSKTESAHSKSVDPDNQLLSRMTRRRLEIEPWRDAMLQVTARLDDRMEGAARELDLPDHLRRTLYGRVGRDEQNDMLRIYDFPPPTAHSPARDLTTTPLQQLFVLNSPFVESQSATLATTLLESSDATIPDRVDRCYQALFQRSPDARERAVGERFLSVAGNAETGDLDRWRWYIQSLLGLNEFLFID